METLTKNEEETLMTNLKKMKQFEFFIDSQVLV